MNVRVLLIVAALCLAVSALKTSAGPYPTEFYGYMPISEEHKSAMFYSLRASTNETLRKSAPLVMWLQGGPGATSFFGDYLENGPETLYKANNSEGYAFKTNEHAWTNHATMLYVDNPVGTGFSYTMDPAGFSTTDTGIAANLVTFLKGFVKAHPEYTQNKNDFWVFCESYGGKMTAYYGAALVSALAAKELDINFKGVSLGDGWVDPVDCMKSYGPYLKGFSQLNEQQVETINKYASYAQSALEEGNGFEATNQWGNQQTYISQFTANVNWYNDLYYYDYTAENQLMEFLGGAFTKARGSLIPSGVGFNNQSMDVFNKMGGSFMNDGISQVETILNAGYQVHVYGGQLDLIVDVICIEKWMSKLNWADLSNFQSATRTPLYTAGSQNVQLFLQEYNNLHYWQVMKAGHMVPLDNPAAAELMMTKVTGTDSSNIKANEVDPKGAVRINKRHAQGKLYRP